MDTPSPYQGAERFPVTPASRHTVFRSYPSEQELSRSQQLMERGWPHIRPGSVLVAAMGNHWRGPSWNKVVDMVDFSQQQGVYCALQEIQDRCFNPYDALGTMRNEAILTALGEGFEYICFLDNDVQPEPDFLTKLMAWNMPIVAPYVVEPGTGTKLFGPALNPGTGLQRAKWCVLSMLLFHASVFRAPHMTEFWRDALGADEGYHFQKFHYYGYHLYIDTGVQLQVGHRPLFPLAMNRMSSGAMRDVESASKALVAHLGGILARKGVPLQEADTNELSGALTEFIRVSKGDRDIFLQQKIERFVEPPDRRPIDPNSPWMKDGEYAPFLIRLEQEKARREQAAKGGGQQVAAPVSPIGTVNPGAVEKALAVTQVGYG